MQNGLWRIMVVIQFEASLTPPWPDYDEREVCSGLRGIEVGEARPAKRLTGKSIRTGFRREV